MVLPLRVLIVDDNAHFLGAASDLLDREGMTVVGVASTGVEAHHLADSLEPDVILIDIDLGDESGLDLARTFKAVPRRGPPSVILISAYSEEDLADAIDDSQGIAFLPKSKLSGRAISEKLDALGDGSPDAN